MDLIAIIYLFIVFFLIAWVADRLPFIKAVRNISKLSRISFETIQAEDMDDSAKQGILLGNSFGILKQSLLIIALTALLLLILFLCFKASMLLNPLSFNYLTGFLISFTGILVSIVSFLSYFLLKKLYGRFSL